MFSIILVSSLFLHTALCDYYVILTGDTRVVLGGTVHRRVEVYTDAGFAATGTFRYIWTDYAPPKQEYQNDSTSYVSEWNVTYDADKYKAGTYNVTVTVQRKNWIGFWETIPGRSLEFVITTLLTGELQVFQHETGRKQYVATNSTAWHNISLQPRDADFLKHDKPHVLTYWFVDCEYQGLDLGLSRAFNYSKVDTTHYVEALVVASVPPKPAPTTTTPAPNTTTTTTLAPNTTTTTTTTVAPKTTSTTTTTPAPKTTTEVVKTAWQEWLQEFSNSSAVSKGYCINITTIPKSPESTYGYFNKKLVAKAPVQLVNMNGSNWLQGGDILNVGLNCNGSGPFYYCVQLANGQYNVTGNETCDRSKAKPLNDCGLIFNHLFTTPQEYTLIFIISNSVSKLVTPFGINVYKVTKQPQLSVIIVPVVFSILAVVSIIFGVAFYFHSRRTLTIEVADFDFGQQTSELEYKTFMERLRESVMHSFFRTNDPVDADSSWSPSRKYGSMQ